MAYIKLTANGVSRFVEEGKVSKIRDIREKFLSDVEVDFTGNIKKYSADDVASYLGCKQTKEDIYTIFNLSKPNKQEAPRKNDKVEKVEKVDKIEKTK